jgi:hypothetical protein
MKLCYIPLFAGLLTIGGCARPGSQAAAPKPNAAPPTQAQAKKAEPTSDAAEAKIKATLAKLSDEDREASENQRFCAVNTTSRLGSMGRPPKITIKNAQGDKVDVFLCCSGCEAEARKDEAKTSARVFEMVITNTLAKLSPEDRKAAEKQRFCASSKDSRLGSMDVPTKVMVKDRDGKEHPIFFCCGGCERILQPRPNPLLGVEKLLVDWGCIASHDIETMQKQQLADKALAAVEDFKKENPAPAPK